MNPCNWTFLDRDRFDMKGWLIIVCFIDFARNKNLRSTHIISNCDIHILHLYVYTCTVPQKMTNSALFPIKFQVRNICFKNLNQLPMQFQSFPVSAFGYMDLVDQVWKSWESHCCQTIWYWTVVVIRTYGYW